MEIEQEAIFIAEGNFNCLDLKVVTGQLLWSTKKNILF